MEARIQASSELIAQVTSSVLKSITCDAMQCMFDPTDLSKGKFEIFELLFNTILDNVDHAGGEESGESGSINSVIAALGGHGGD